MKKYIFKIGNKNLEFLCPSPESAFIFSKNYSDSYGWKGKIKLINILPE